MKATDLDGIVSFVQSQPVDYAVVAPDDPLVLGMVDALEDEDMHGRSASDLAYFIADPSRRVSAAAFSAWSSVLEDAHGDRRIHAILETADILRGFSGGLTHRSHPYRIRKSVPGWF